MILDFGLFRRLCNVDTIQQGNDESFGPDVFLEEVVFVRVAGTRASCDIVISRNDNNSLLWRTSRTERSEEHTSELQSLMRISYAVFCLTKNKSEPTTNKQ